MIALALALAPVYLQAAIALVEIGSVVASATATAGFAAKPQDLQLQEIAAKVVATLSLAQ